jgi:hypothetical protein
MLIIETGCENVGWVAVYGDGSSDIVKAANFSRNQTTAKFTIKTQCF